MRTCSGCGVELVTRRQVKFCSVRCQRAADQRARLAEWLVTGKAVQASKRGHYIRTYLFEQQGGLCAVCGMPDEWEGRSLQFILDHIDGDAADNRRENLRLVCPNCDSQLPTYKAATAAAGGPGASSGTPTASRTDSLPLADVGAGP